MLSIIRIEIKLACLMIERKDDMENQFMRADEVARELGVGREKVLAWMETEEYKGCWRRRYREYVRYLQGLGAASLEEQVRGQDEKLRASAAQAILKLGEMDEEEGGGVKVEFAMEKPV